MFLGYSSLLLFSRLPCTTLLCFPTLPVPSFPFFPLLWQMKLQHALKSSPSLTLHLLLLFFENGNAALLTTITNRNQPDVSERTAQCHAAARAASHLRPSHHPSQGAPKSRPSPRYQPPLLETGRGPDLGHIV